MHSPETRTDIPHTEVFRELSTATKAILDRIPEKTIPEIARVLCSARDIYVLGVGHSGFLSRTLSMKLNHIGLRAYTVFDEINPPFGRDSVLVGVSQSGETTTVVALAEKACRLGGSVLAFTGNRNSTLGRCAANVVELPVDHIDMQLNAFRTLGDLKNQNVRGAFFGSALYSLFYSVTITAARIRGEDSESINSRHANLE